MLEHKHYKEALSVQDACNLSGVVHSFSKILPAIWESCDGTDEVNRHPICRLFAEQIMFLTGGGMGDSDTYRDAYNRCMDVVEGKEQP